MKMRGIVLFLLFSICSRVESGLSQTLGGTVRGQVVSPSGTAFANVRVTAFNEETGEVRQTLSGSDGEFALTALAPGSYRLEAEMSGFRKYAGKGVHLQVGQNLRVNICLELGPPAEEIIVTASQGLVEPDTAGLGTVIGNRQIVSFPLDGRNFLQLSLLVPGPRRQRKDRPVRCWAHSPSTSAARGRIPTISFWMELTTTIPSSTRLPSIHPWTQFENLRS